MIQKLSIPLRGADIYCDFESDIGPVAEYPRFEYSMKDVKRAGEIIAGELPWNDETAPQIRDAFHIAVLPGPPIFACGANYGTAGHPVSRARDIADRAYVLDQGGVIYHAAARELLADNDIKQRYCSV